MAVAAFWASIVEPGRMQVAVTAVDRSHSSIDEPVETFAASSAMTDIPMSSTMIRSAGADDLADSLTDGVVGAMPANQGTALSMANQATVRPLSMAVWARALQKWPLPVPKGPQMHRFRAGRPIRGCVASAE